MLTFLIRQGVFLWSPVNKACAASKGILMLRFSTSVINQTHGSSPTVPDAWAVVDLLNHSTRRMEKYVGELFYQ